MPQKDHPDHHDGELVLRFYELRREPVMREARANIIQKFHPLTQDDALAILKGDHPLNAAYRQVSTYWEMVYGMARNGIVHGDYMMESNGEGLLLFTRMEPWLDAVRAAQTPLAYRNAQWVAENTATGKATAERFRARQRAAMDAAGKS
ncbi:MAG: hypothetical protein LCH84_14040 [Gemmatimonadetes bacterium]|nr:hypothetical protein [Gemmatimonadota bacterium]